MKLVIKPSTKSDKKYMAIFYEGDKKVKTTHFGQKGMDDYTISKNYKKRFNFT